MDKNGLLPGEASESDDEYLNIGTKSLALEIPGEASDSDEDVYDKSADTAAECKTNLDYFNKNNLLQRKLIETNISIWRDLNLFVKSLVTTASKELVDTDRLMIKSEVTMQAVLSSLKRGENNMQQLNERCEAVFTDNFVSNIKI